MSKGYILVDVPERCMDCRFCSEVLEGIASCCELEDDLEDDESLKEIDVDYTQTKPDWCPVRELPEKKEPTQFPISPLLPWQYTDYDKGWNDCIKQMEVE